MREIYARGIRFALSLEGRENCNCRLQVRNAGWSGENGVAGRNETLTAPCCSSLISTHLSCLHPASRIPHLQPAIVWEFRIPPRIPHQSVSFLQWNPSAQSNGPPTAPRCASSTNEGFQSSSSSES